MGGKCSAVRRHVRGLELSRRMSFYSACTAGGSSHVLPHLSRVCKACIPGRLGSLGFKHCACQIARLWINLAPI